tara:strand:- start:400 stop:540 length:141 start_codon:yes stop_codon:yes gene_type:complete
MNKRDRQEMKDLILETLNEWHYEKTYRRFAGKTPEELSQYHTNTKK